MIREAKKLSFANIVCWNLQIWITDKGISFWLHYFSLIWSHQLCNEQVGNVLTSLAIKQNIHQLIFQENDGESADTLMIMIWLVDFLLEPKLQFWPWDDLLISGLWNLRTTYSIFWYLLSIFWVKRYWQVETIKKSHFLPH